MKRRLIYYWLLLLLSISLSCKEPSVQFREPIKFVPSSSIIMLQVNWSKVYTDDYLKAIVEGDEIKKLLYNLNLNDQQIDELVAFAGSDDFGEETSGIILKGSFRSRSVMGALKAQGWIEDSYEGYTLYRSPAEDVWVTALKSHMLVVGVRMGVENVIEVEKDPDASIISMETISTLVRRFDRNRSPISMILVFPQAYQDMGSTALDISSMLLDAAGLGPLGTVLDKIGFAKGLACSISRKDDSFPIELMVMMKDEEAAEFLSGSLNLLKSFSKWLPEDGMSQSDREAVRAFQSMMISREKDILSIRLVMAKEDFAPRNGREGM